MHVFHIYIWIPRCPHLSLQLDAAENKRRKKVEGGRIEGRMHVSCENKHVKQALSAWGLGFAAVTTLGMRSS